MTHPSFMTFAPASQFHCWCINSVLNVKAVVGAFSVIVITNLRMELFEALVACVLGSSGHTYRVTLQTRSSPSATRTPSPTESSSSTARLACSSKSLTIISTDIYSIHPGTSSASTARASCTCPAACAPGTSWGNWSTGASPLSTWVHIYFK